MVLGLPGIGVTGDIGDFRTVYLNCGREYCELRPPSRANLLVADGVQWVVAFDAASIEWDMGKGAWSEIAGQDGSSVRYQELGADEKVVFGQDGYEISSEHANESMEESPRLSFIPSLHSNRLEER
jgi:hypothetical protein